MSKETVLEKREAERDRVLDCILPHVMFDGWSRKALKHGAEDAGISASDLDRLFPAGVPDCIGHFLDRADREMVLEFQRRNPAQMKVREKIAAAVRIRLEQAAPHKEAVRRTLAYMAVPGQGGLGTRGLYRTVDAIWKAAGDTSTDYNFYTKRGLLAAVYSSTLLFWLNDTSEDHVETWDFLDRRIQNVMEIPKLTGRLKDAAAKFTNPFEALKSCAPKRRPFAGAR
ncbi:COQ9 family protein [Nisaea acidiphila]|uniref:COQ9 family protein n=1 Tax=Nisaea acidiphila TaxID=1862145 RepID=A0A9J7AXM7_9PROT|nr:COQ9 family protein [Nisaea acidiphila]UUX51004.1 COQ9 family protein [Nisaea acidiphila]